MVRRYVNQRCIFALYDRYRIPIHENFPFKNCFETVINIYSTHKTHAIYFPPKNEILSLFPCIIYFFYRSAIIEIDTSSID